MATGEATRIRRPPEQAPLPKRHAPFPSYINVGDTERLLSMLAGGIMVWTGLKKRSWGGSLRALIGGGLISRGMTGHSRLYTRTGVNTAVLHNRAIGVRAKHEYRIQKAVTIQRSPQELYNFWRNLENLPRIMKHLLSVQVLDENRSHWVAHAPGDAVIEWDAEIINDHEGELIAWRSLEGSEVDTAGSVHFRKAPHERGTVVSVSVKYDPPGGKIGARIAELMGEGLDQQIQEDLRVFKQMMEAGEIATTAGQPMGPPCQ